jgi:hypothetical protein
MASESSSLSSSYGSSVSASLGEAMSPRPTFGDLESLTIWLSSRNNSLARECPRSLWQRDSDAPVCSMMLCNKPFQAHSSFAMMSFFNPGPHRHHCRQCGRVVCGDCSKGAKYLLPSQPRSSLRPVLLRVCDACLHSSETFEFKPPDLQSPPIPSLKRSKSFSRQTLCVSDQHFPSLTRPHSLSDLLRTNQPTQPGPEPNLSESYNLLHRSKKNAALACADDDQKSQAETPVVDGQGPHGPSSPSAGTSYKGSSPQKIPAGDRRGGFGHDLEASSYYQGLLRHEPAALRLLLRTALDRTAQGDDADSA